MVSVSKILEIGDLCYFFGTDVSASPVTGGLLYCFGTALRAGGAPPLYPAGVGDLTGGVRTRVGECPPPPPVASPVIGSRWGPPATTRGAHPRPFPLLWERGLGFKPLP